MEENQKSLIWGRSFGIFKFLKLRIPFRINLKQCFLAVINIAKVTLRFCQNFLKYKIDLKDAVAMS